MSRWHRLTIAEKFRAMIPHRVLYRCVLCGVRVTKSDRAMHLTIHHGGGVVGRMFEAAE